MDQVEIRQKIMHGCFWLVIAFNVIYGIYPTLDMPFFIALLVTVGVFSTLILSIIQTATRAKKGVAITYLVFSIIWAFSWLIGATGA